MQHWTPHHPFGLGLLALALASLAGGAALAQRGPVGSAPPGGSLGLQLGSVPAIAPRGGGAAAVVRTVRLTQLDATGNAIGAAREIACPDSGCQQVIALVVNNSALTFLADVQFVARGAYFALQPRSVALERVVEFEKGRPGPIFIRDDGRGAMQRSMRFTVTSSGSMRALETAPNPRTLTTGTVFNRKMDPDVTLLLEIGTPRPGG